MISRKSLLALAASGLLAVSACTGGTGTEDTVLGGTETTQAGTETTEAGDMAAVVSQIQAEADQLAQAIQNSAVAAELQTSWDSFRAELDSTLAAIQAGGTIDTSGLEAQISQFQTTLDSVSDRAEAEIVSAWSSLRSVIEGLLTTG